jgi:RNA-binding protein YhbY
MKWILYIAFIVFVIFSGRSQTGTTYLEKQDVLIGEKISLTYHFSMPKNGEIKIEPFKNVISVKNKNPKNKQESKNRTEIEILDAFFDTMMVIEGHNEWFGTYVITAWDSGLFVIPRTSLLYLGKQINFPETYLKVSLSKKIKGKGIYDIEENFQKISPEPFSFKKFHNDNWMWIYPVLLLIIGVFMYFKFVRGYKSTTFLNELTLEEKTILKIEELEKSKLWTLGKLKEHYVSLSFIMRAYLSIRYNINLLEKTTHEAKLLLTQKGLNQVLIENITTILEQSDLVKFAKSEPEEITALRLSVLAKKIVKETSEIRVDDV